MFVIQGIRNLADQAIAGHCSIHQEGGMLQIPTTWQASVYHEKASADMSGIVRLKSRSDMALHCRKKLRKLRHAW